jgi:transposase
MRDESGKSVMPGVVATWAPRGKTPRLPHLFRHVHIALIGAITPTGKLHYRLHRHRIRSDQVIGFLRHLLGRISGRIERCWDGGAIHTSKGVERFLEENKGRLRAHFLPAYAPEVTPQELVGQRLKHVELRNVGPRNADELIDETRAGMERIRHHPELFPAFFEHAGLSPYPA